VKQTPSPFFLVTTPISSQRKSKERKKERVEENG